MVLRLLFIIVLLLITVDGFYTIFMSQGLNPSFWFSIMMWLGAALAFAKRDQSAARTEAHWKDQGFWLTHFLPCLLATLLLFGFFAGLFNLTKTFLDFLEGLSARITGTPTMVIISGLALLSIMAFKLRKNFRFFYGLFEATLGLVIANQNFTLSHDPYELLTVVLVGGIYLVVRGLDNMAQGIDSDKALCFSRKKFPKFTSHIDQILKLLL